MSIFQQPKIFRKMFYSWLVFIFICVIIFISINQIIIFNYKNQKILSKLNINQAKIEKLTTENQEKEKAYNFLKTERGSEEHYRDLYPVVKEGEKVIVLYNSTGSDLEILSTSTDFWTTMQKKIRFFIDNYTNL